MRHIEIILESGTFEGAVTMRSMYSQFRATRVSKADLSDYAVDLDYPGLYMLLIGTDTVYVGQTAMNTILFSLSAVLTLLSAPMSFFTWRMR